MNDVKRAMIAALLLAFVAGIGAGAWIGDLRAGSAEPKQSVDRRVEWYQERYELTPSQVRQIRDVLLRYDAGRSKVLTELDTERWQRIDRLADEARNDVAGILGIERQDPKKDESPAPESGG